MTAALALLGYALLVGVLAPLPLARAGWTHRAPRLAVALWQALALSFVTALVLAVHHLAVPGVHLHLGLAGLMHVCGVDHPGGLAAGGNWRLLLPAAVALWPLGRFTAALARTARHRRRHRAVLDLVAARDRDLGAHVLDHDTPAAYCLPGRRSRIVLTRGALELLTDRQLAAVLAHERAHVTGRHHLARTAADALAAAFPFLPLARLAARETPLLLEMAADDRAVRRHPRAVLAAAMYRVADGQVPRTAFAAGGPAALLRVRRLLAPAPAPHPALRAAATLASAAAPVLPLLVTCGPILP
ncbi:M56 family metallopeptidase [Kitasatospora cineracea]|uniref:Peptidase M48-like protein n=1 Tax=Kitasatospora cineracea TaxID=88074 RepID=A0A3N4RXB6_9ACTN|nr:M56 family metallopeptidase [Kitasatospora cineracea]ROR37854.1 peptidase M48-like protein [Kitasatospora cineracea]RPE28724.1 peptidase M48-like protein [Kitasatospora cineracea]